MKVRRPRLDNRNRNQPGPAISNACLHKTSTGKAFTIASAGSSVYLFLSLKVRGEHISPWRMTVPSTMKTTSSAILVA